MNEIGDKTKNRKWILLLFLSIIAHSMQIYDMMVHRQVWISMILQLSILHQTTYNDKQVDASA